MNILLLNYEFPPLGGGGGVACHILCKELVKQGHTVDYVTSHFKDFEKEEVIDGINILRVPVFGRKDLNHANFQSLLWYPVTSLLKGYSLCRQNKYDIINAQFVVPSGISGYVLSQLFGIPLVTSLHGGDIYDPTKRLSPHRNGFFQRIVARLLRSSNLVIAQSTNTQNNALTLYKFNGDVKIIPLGFNPPSFREVSREHLGLSPDDIILISVGRVVKRKGYNEALHALSKLKEKKNWKYIIMGDGPEREPLEQLTKKLGLEDRILFTGFVEEELKYQYLSNANIYFLSSHHEGFGICLQEAMSVGLSIVSTDNGGQMDFLTDDENAIIVPTCDISRMASAVEKLIDNADIRKRMGEANIEKVKDFSGISIAERHIQLFRQLRSEKE